MIDLSADAYRETDRIQRDVAAPYRSAWVSANAGSGKTHVLTGRVIRLLMGEGELAERADPSSILCITYTKAAAAEMRARLFKTLGEWALLDDAPLEAAIKKRLGDDVHLPPLGEVRQLFARALDTPGGLKIQTIHSFCERVLHRFPVEAGLLPGFDMLDDHAQNEIFARLFAKLIRTQGGGHGAAFVRLLAERNEADTLFSDLKGGAGLRGASDLRTSFGLPGGEPEDWCEACLSSANLSFFRDLYNRRGDLPTKARGKNQVPRLDALEALVDPLSGSFTERFDRLCDAWLTNGDKTPVKSVAHTETEKAVSGYTDNIRALQEDLSTTWWQRKMYASYQTADALRELSEEFWSGYEKTKAQLGLVDYDDLIKRTEALLRDVNNAWVTYKLDAGITHVLLDEAQDTASPQWSVLSSLTEEFFAGDGVKQSPRTLFVVGDKKQSIYGFQGADAQLFNLKRDEVKQKASAAAYLDAPMQLSFRSSPCVLSFVDALFEGEAGAGLDIDPVRHVAAKPTLPGTVELWPLCQRRAPDTDDYWELPVDAARPGDAVERLAREVAADIHRRVRDGVLIVDGDRQRPTTYSDILILCRTRKAIFHAIVKELSRQGIPNAGTDKMRLMEDIAVLDLQSALRYAVNPSDSLSLAEILKSPLYGFDDDDLMSIVERYGRAGSLDGKLRKLAGDESALAAKSTRALTELDEAARRGRQEGPFAFLSVLLEQGAPSGRARFQSRLGARSNEALDELVSEALAFERDEVRTLDGFLAHLSQLKDREIKKEANAGGNVVRIMTVHGAKGLEAPIVYLPDTTLASDQFKGTVDLPNPGGTPVKMAVPKDMGKTPPFKDALAAAKAREKEEYRRLLYVAATRAEQCLIIAGVEAGKGKKDERAEDRIDGVEVANKCWYGLARRAMAAQGDVRERSALWRDDDEPVRSLVQAAPPGLAVRRADPALAPAASPASMPDWLNAPVPKERAAPVFFPSADEEEAAPGPVLRPAPSGEASLSPRTRGRLLHSLFEALPEVSPDLRAAFAARVVARRAPGLPAGEAEQLANEALSVVADPAFADVFTDAARAEVSLRGKLYGRSYSAQIDRLYVSDGVVRFVDFKTHRPPPSRIEDVAPAILRQMAIYGELLAKAFPDHRVEGALLWTSVARLMPLPAETMAQALETVACDAVDRS